MLDLNRLRILAAVARHGSVTAAAAELHYSQPSVSHHLARLEAETGAQLFQRAGRGIRLTEAGLVLAERATEILGRVESASAELDAHVGLSAGRVRVAVFGSALVALMPEVSAELASRHPGLRLDLVDTHPPEAIAMLRAGEVDVAVVFRYDETEPDPPGIRLTHLLDDPTYLLTTDDRDTIGQHRDDRWVAGCVRCRAHLVELCDREGFEPEVAFTTDDMVGIQALVASGMGVATIPGLALRGHRNPDVNAHEVPGAPRHVYAATYGEPPDPPPTAALLDVLTSLA
ncbi:LysR family transcriptional regulator [Aeromicrobium ginsengisoli]|uniref:LysR family transcriptional regulator n=1 Tax=Aeromicrobium ginsengisoli TaxID=363867 RepID=A0A5M4FK15_9ACTN|nr:LysR family transcriptional regulator [Aeromicrobium ginsengisoli]KAA1400312.1 LysR family transcriptional regulator [Aeromicrobium ginsengisoli]